MPLSKRIEKQKLYIKFAYARGLRIADGSTLRGFTLVNEKGNEREVEASIEKDEIIIPLDNNSNVEVRYGWQPFTRANLVNEAGLPTSTFKLNLR